MTVHLGAESCDSAIEDLRAAEPVIVRHYPRIVEIQKAVCAHFGMSLTEMLSERRARVVARPRQIAMYLAKHLTQMSLPVIGQHFGGRDHTTVMHAIRTIDDLRQKDDGMEADIIVLRLAIGMMLGARLRRHGLN